MSDVAKRFWDMEWKKSVNLFDVWLNEIIMIKKKLKQKNIEKAKMSVSPSPDMP